MSNEPRTGPGIRYVFYEPDGGRTRLVVLSLDGTAEGAAQLEQAAREMKGLHDIELLESVTETLGEELPPGDNSVLAFTREATDEEMGYTW